MSIVVQHESGESERWFAALQRALPGVAVHAWPETGDPGKVDLLVTGRPDAASLTLFPNLRLIAGTGAGVERLIRQVRDLSLAVPVMRVVDAMLTRSMAEYVLAAALYDQRKMHHYAAAQSRAEWAPLERTEPEDFSVGILGLGVLGLASASLLRSVGFRVLGWSRGPRQVDGVDCFHGPDGLHAMLALTDCLVCLLPLTPATAGIVNAGTLARLARGATLVNAGRGGHVVESDLLDALRSGHIAHATLDVFATEPLPADHPFWAEPNLTLTPHVASITVPESAIQGIVANYSRMHLGLPLEDLVDFERGY